MEKFVDELQKQLSFKDTTVAGDIVLLVSDDPRMAIYALVTAIEPDPARKKGSWWNVSMQVLTVPPQEVVWTLREPQFTGMEFFTFSGIKHFMKAVRFTPVQGTTAPGLEGDKGGAGSGRQRLRVIK